MYPERFFLFNMQCRQTIAVLIAGWLSVGVALASGAESASADRVSSHVLDVFLSQGAANSVSPDLAELLMPDVGLSAADGRWSDEFAAANGCNNTVRVIAQGPGSLLYLGGAFTSCGGVPAQRIAAFDTATNTFSALGSAGGNGLSATVWTIIVDGDDVYAGGDFATANLGSANEVPASRVARWTGSQWEAIGSGGGNGVNAEVRALTFYGGDLYVGGFFTEANVGGATVAANRVARWDGDVWTSVGSAGGNGVDDEVRVFAVFDGRLYIGGGFTQANVGAAITANRLVSWDGSDWAVLGSGAGNGLNNDVWALLPTTDDLYVGGAFVQANVGAGITARRIARWDGTAWHGLGSNGGNGVNSDVRALAISGNNLYAAGFFTQANVSNPIPANRIARWNGNDWTALGSGLLGFVSSLVLTDPDTLYVGGGFTQAGDKPASRLARYATRGTLSVSLAGSGNGSVTSTVADIDCPTDCSDLLDWDLLIPLTATPVAGSAFVGWSGGGCSGTGVCEVELIESTSVTAQFELTYSVGGAVSGLATGGLVLQNNGADDLAIAADGVFSFVTPLVDGSTYNVTVQTQPAGQVCSVINGAGTLSGANITNVEIDCVMISGDQAFYVGSFNAAAVSGPAPPQTINFPQAFSEPPVVIVMPGNEGLDPRSVRVRNVTATGFELLPVTAPPHGGSGP
ncbi:MAG: hypothetical protein ACXIUL_03575, partial [Wenzhouxiangella sp.]